MTEKEKQLEASLREMKKQYFAVLDGIYNVCAKTAMGYKSKTIPLSLLKVAIESTKKSIAKGMKKNARRTTGK
jgi:hypothetical protein